MNTSGIVDELAKLPPNAHIDGDGLDASWAAARNPFNAQCAGVNCLPPSGSWEDTWWLVNNDSGTSGKTTGRRGAPGRRREANIQKHLP